MLNSSFRRILVTVFVFLYFLCCKCYNEKNEQRTGLLVDTCQTDIMHGLHLLRFSGTKVQSSSSSSLSESSSLSFLPTRAILKYKPVYMERPYRTSVNSNETITTCFDAVLWQNISWFYLRLATLELVRPMPMHFSRCGANLDAAKFREQFGHTHSTCLALMGTWPNMSSPLSITISVMKVRQKSWIKNVHTC